ncbi:MAG: 16S rRNA (guanine(527)-N(7))-methyltransferase RsmG [Nitrospiraceae bacterium]|nr:MAG: 16S rRNA (guanine(527)-N(7))-methyltransferase RsmG [Nitrospiraceae bacterium]
MDVNLYDYYYKSVSLIICDICGSIFLRLMKADDLFKKGLNELNIPCYPEQIRAFMTFLSELKKWNGAYNLTALKTDEDIVIKHFLDSLLYLRTLPAGTLKLVDAGTGAGFPGIPIKIIMPGIDLTLIESSKKKAAFLRHIIRSLKLSSVTVLEQRLESLGKEYESTFDVIVSRATFSIKEFLKLAGPYIKEGGILVLNKGPKAAKEIRDSGAENAVRDILHVRLPFTHAERQLLVLECKNRPYGKM